MRQQHCSKIGPFAGRQLLEVVRGVAHTDGAGGDETVRAARHTVALPLGHARKTEPQRPIDAAVVEPEMTWVPLVTMWQVMFDLLAAGLVPPGYAHLFRHGEYVDGWIGVTQPEDWTDTDTEALVRMLATETGE